MEERLCAVKKKKNNAVTLKEKLRNEVVAKMVELGLWSEDLQKEIPTYWDDFSNFVIFNRKFFSSDCWTVAGDQIWKIISKVFSGKSIALQGSIQNNNFRSPRVTVVYGESPWVQYTDNGILYTWNVEFTMFCTGNASERHRIAKLECENQVVVDMFAGIGYFTMPYLLHAKAKQVIACEWNPVSVEALKLNLSKNEVAEKCTVLEGDVRNCCLYNVADHINMGLIPSCEQYWSTAAEMLNLNGGVIHVHGNVTSLKRNQQLVVQCEQCSSLLSEVSIELSVSSTQVLSNFTTFLSHGQTEVKAKRADTENLKWKKLEWFVWGVHVSHTFCKLLSEAKNSGWTVTPNFIHRVKAYAPHIDHLVIDIHCEKYETS